MEHKYNYMMSKSLFFVLFSFLPKETFGRKRRVNYWGVKTIVNPLAPSGSRLWREGLTMILAPNTIAIRPCGKLVQKAIPKQKNIQIIKQILEINPNHACTYYPYDTPSLCYGASTPHLPLVAGGRDETFPL